MISRWESTACPLFATGVLLVAVCGLARRSTADSETTDAAANPQVVSIGMTVSRIERSVAFYCDVLGFEIASDHEAAARDPDALTKIENAPARVVQLKLGGELLELTEYLTPGRPMPVDSRSNDLSFQHIAIIVRNMDQAYARLRRFNVEHASPSPQRLPDWNKNAGGIRAYYFRDPDGHFLEILQFPSDKGDPKWHRPTNRLFLGIDHTAIVVSDTERSLSFYRDTLGMKVAGESNNYGPEQQRLNNVPGARLRITTLRGASGPGIELLEYLLPTDGRPRPTDSKPNDLIHWQTAVVVDSLLQAERKFRTEGAPPIISETQPAADFSPRSALIHDPDGHAVQLSEQRVKE